MIFILVYGDFSLANVFDKSSVDRDYDFFKGPVSVSEEVFNISDFIFPLDIYDKESLEKIIAESNKVKKSKLFDYIVKKDENLWSISKKFNIPLKEILSINNLKENSVIREGQKIVIPGIKPQTSLSISRGNTLVGVFVSALKEIGDFVIPTSGFNYGIKHSNNGSDIAAPCGTPVYSSNSGLVIESADGWNGGYGNYIIIDHNNSIFTLYGHLSFRLVNIGEKVHKGQLIGYVGNTGNTVGQTGCHLHFEVRGAKNPLIR